MTTDTAPTASEVLALAAADQSGTPCSPEFQRAFGSFVRAAGSRGEAQRQMREAALLAPDSALARQVLARS